MTTDPFAVTCDIKTCFTGEQIAQLLRAINPKRVSTDGKGFSHVEAYDIRAHLTRLFGFGNWSLAFVGGPPRQVFEDVEMRQKKNKAGEFYGDPYKAWTVCYASAMSLRVRCQHGTWLGPWEDAATGEATNQPSRGDAHDLAMKTSVSQAVKRAAVNLADQFGLSLYAKGSTAALVRRTLVMPDTEPSTDAVDSHITQQLPREDEAAEPAEDPRTTSQTPAAPGPQAPVAAGPVEGGVTPVAPPSTPPDDVLRAREAQRIRDLAAGDIPTEYRNAPGRWVMHLTGEAMKAKALTELVESLISPNKVALKVVLEQALKAATDAQRKAS